MGVNFTSPSPLPHPGYLSVRKHFWLSQLERCGYYWHLVGEARMLLNLPLGRTAPQQRNYSAWHVSSAQVEKCCCKLVNFFKLQYSFFLLIALPLFPFLRVWKCVCVYALKRENIVSVKACFYLFMFFFPWPASYSFLKYHSLVCFLQICLVSPLLTAPRSTVFLSRKVWLLTVCWIKYR